MERPGTRKAKIRELKTNINTSREELTSVLKDYKAYIEIYKEMDFAPEDIFEQGLKKLTQARTKEFNIKMGEYRAVIEALTSELDLTRKNKHESKHFEWKPSPPNRKARREYAKYLSHARRPSF